MNAKKIKAEYKRLLRISKEASADFENFRKSITYKPKNLDVVIQLLTGKEMVVLDDYKGRYRFYYIKEGANASYMSCRTGREVNFFVKIDKDINYVLKKTKRGYVHDKILKQQKPKEDCCTCCCHCECPCCN